MSTPEKDKILNETDVEVCLELARMYNTEDLTHPPFWPIEDDSKDDKEEKD